MKDDEEEEDDDDLLLPVSLIRSAAPPWRLHAECDHALACDRAEKWIDIRTQEEKARFLDQARLRYDKRKRGNGLSVSRNMDALNEASAPLEKGDKLLAQKSLPDTAKYGSIAPPLKLCFWRKSAESLCKRRNPMFGQDIGFTIQKCYGVDFLHTVCFGPEAFAVLECFWRSVESRTISGGGEYVSRCEQAARVQE